MEDQLTVQLPGDLSRALTAAHRMQRRRAEVLRIALREYLGLSGAARTRPADRVRRLIGSLESGVSDLAERHRAYVVESLRRGR